MSTITETFLGLSPYRIKKKVHKIHQHNRGAVSVFLNGNLQSVNGYPLFTDRQRIHLNQLRGRRVRFVVKDTDGKSFIEYAKIRPTTEVILEYTNNPINVKGKKIVNVWEVLIFVFLAFSLFYFLFHPWILKIVNYSMK